MALKIKLYIKQSCLFIRLDGEMDQFTADDLRLKLSELIIKYNVKNIVFNMKELSFMDSSGIGVIIGRYNQIKHSDGEIVLCELNNDIKKIVKLSGLERICKVKESEELSKYYLGVA